jgi:hypothetical protein
VRANSPRKFNFETLKGGLVAVSAQSNTQDAACLQLSYFKDHLNAMNAQVLVRLPMLKYERAQLDAFFMTVLRNSDRLEDELSYVSFNDKSLTDHLRRKVFLDRVVTDPVLLEFRILRDIEPAPPHLHYLTRNKVNLFGASLLVVALWVLLVAYFRVLLKSRIAQ